MFEPTCRNFIGLPHLRFCVAVCFLALSLIASADRSALASDSPDVVDVNQEEQSPEVEDLDSPTVGSAQKGGPERATADGISDAEQIADLQRTIESETKRLQELEAEIDGPDSEYVQAESEFRDLDGHLDASRERLQELIRDGKTTEAAALEKEIQTIEKLWDLAKERFELAIEERKTLREEMATLTQKIQKDRDALAELTGTREAQNSEDDSKESAEDSQNASRDDDGDRHSVRSKTRSDATPASDESDGSEGVDGPDHSNESPEEPSQERDEELIQAEAEAREKEEDADEAQEQAQALAARIADLQKIITQEQKVYGLARKQADLALATRRALEEELNKKTSEAVSPEELQELRQEIVEAKERYTRALAAVTESTDRLNDNRSELANLQSQQIVALQEAEKKRLEAQAAQEVVEGLRNPFAVRNMLKWLVEHGPKVLVYLLVMILLLQMAKVSSHRIIKLMAGATGRGTAIERENRAKTLVGVFQNAASVAIVIGGSLMILDELGAKVSVLLGGVAVAGLAVAFGAQNLIKDYFYGFVMLVENQYMINDVVKIGDLTGQVERITLRMTVLRDHNGVVHFIPNGQINCVSNETHGWSRASFEIGVAYKENVDGVIEVLADLARQLRQDPNFGPMMLEDATPPGVDQLGDSAVLIKFHIKTRPHQHGVVRRELLRRIKNTFDELGIELPFPHRTVYHRSDQNPSSTGAGDPVRKCA